MKPELWKNNENNHHAVAVPCVRSQTNYSPKILCNDNKVFDKANKP